MRGKRDRQRGRVYAWENRIIAPRDTTLLAFGRAQAAVDAIWADIGLQYPPRVEPLRRQARATLASATRISICLPANTPSWCLLHELAHAMTSEVDGISDGHGPIFMGVYLKLLSRYLRLNQDELSKSLANDGIEIAPDANPTFVDACHSSLVGDRRSIGIENPMMIVSLPSSACGRPITCAKGEFAPAPLRGPVCR